MFGDVLFEFEYLWVWKWVSQSVLAIVFLLIDSLKPADLKKTRNSKVKANEAEWKRTRNEREIWQKNCASAANADK